MQHARTNGEGSVGQAMNRIDFTVSVEACRPPESARAARTRMLGATAVRSVIKCGWMSWTSAIATGEEYPACVTIERPADIPDGGTGIVGSPLGALGTAGMTGAGAAGTDGIGSGAGVAGMLGTAGVGVLGTETIGAGVLGAGSTGAVGIGNGAGTVTGGLVGGG